MTFPTYHPGIVQGTPEWDAVRAGKWSASKGAVIMGGLDTGGLRDLILDLAWGRVYGPPEGGYRSKVMERGHLVEPEARDWFAFTRDVSVEEVGFVEHATIPHCGWSPDGLFNERRNAIEAKCPLHKAWMHVQETGKVPAEYRWQCKFACFVGQLDGLTFVAYHPRAGGLMVDIEATEADKAQIEERLALLEPKVVSRVAILMGRKP